MQHRNCLKWTILAAMLAAFPAETVFGAGETVYVSTDSSTATYVCDGTGDEVEINLALDAVAAGGGGTVYLRGPARYTLGGGSIKISSKTTLTGDPTAVVTLKDSATWAKDVPIITSKVTGMRDITVCGFEVDGNSTKNLNGRNFGQDYYDCLFFRDVRNLRVHDMYLHDNLNDGLCTSGTSDSVYYYDNVIDTIGHDGYYGYKTTNVWVYGNTVMMHTNSGIRLDGANHAKIYRNTLYTPSGNGGNAGIQISCGLTTIINDVEIYENTIYDTNYAGMWIYSFTNAQAGSLIRIHHNVLYNCGVSNSSYAGGIVTCGFNLVVENNVFDGCHGSAISTRDLYSYHPSGSGYTITARNNFFGYSTNVGSTAGTGYGVWNYLGSTHVMTNEGNCFFGNAGTDYTGTGLTTSGCLTGADPLFVNRAGHDYHLRSPYGRWNGTTFVTTDTGYSPCIDAGVDSSDFSNEPSPNGARINIGRYGNTSEASMSAPVGVCETVPGLFSLSQNAPNPFNPSTTITYSIPAGCTVTLTIYTASGQKVATLVSGKQPAGTHAVEWRPENLASGVFLCRMEAGSFTKTTRLIYMK